MTTRSDWREVQLHDVCRPKQWQTIRQSDLMDAGYTVYGANGVIGFYHSYNHEDPTILIGCRGSCGVINICEPKSWVTGNAMALDDLDTSVVDFRYLVHALRADGLQKAVTGSSQPQITQASLARISIPLPPVKEQRRIASLLDAAEALRAKRQDSLGKLDVLTRSVFVGMFGDPLTAPAVSRRPVGTIGKVITGNTPSRADASYYGDRIEWLKTDNIQESGVITTSAEWLSEAGRAKGREAPPGSTLVVCIAGSPNSIGRVGRLDRTAAFNQQINAIIAGPDVMPEFIFHQLRIAPRLVQQASTNSMKGMVSKSALEAVELLVPPVAAQERFCKIVARAEAVTDAINASSYKVDLLIASVQHRAFRGEV